MPLWCLATDSSNAFHFSSHPHPLPHAAPPDEPIARVKASPMRPRGGKLQPMAGGDGAPPSPEPELVIRAEGHHYGGPGQKVDVLSGPVAVRPRDAVRNGIILEQDSPSGPLVGGRGVCLLGCSVFTALICISDQATDTCLQVPNSCR